MESDVAASDEEILIALAEHGALTVDQITRLLARNANALRRRLRKLSEDGLIDHRSRRLGAGRGRPEHLVVLGSEGLEVLRTKKILPRGDGAAGRARTHCAEHELSVAEVRVQLAQMERLLPEMQARFLTATWPARTDSGDYFAVREKLQLGPNREPLEFIPDAVFSLLHRQLAKTLLFFVEVDMGSQPASSKRVPERDIRRKILNYQNYLGTGKYHRYEQLLNCKLQGFRLLCVTGSVSRWRLLCRQVRAMPPADFIWLTDSDRFWNTGLWAAIWARGGRDDQGPESILGSQIPKQPPTPAATHEQLTKKG